MIWIKILGIVIWLIILAIYTFDYVKEKKKPPFIIFVLAIILIVIAQLQLIFIGR